MMNTFLRKVVITSFVVLTGAIFSYPASAIQTTSKIDINLLSANKTSVIEQVPSIMVEKNSEKIILASCWLYINGSWVYICHQEDNPVVNS